MNLLHLRHPADLQRMPDKHLGDYGVEAFTRAEGCAFQCYSSDPLQSPADRHRHQVSKITEDLGKLERNDRTLETICGPNAIRRWILLVPIHDSSQVVLHASKKALELRAKQLRCLHPEFEVLIQTHKDYPGEVAKMANLGLAQVALTTITVPAPSIRAWRATHTQLITNLETKTAKLETLTVEANRDKFCTMLLKRYLVAENALQELETNFVELWIRLRAHKEAKEADLELRSLVLDQPAVNMLTATVDQYRDELKVHFPALRDRAEGLAWGAVCDWLLRCPLDFPDRQ